MPRIDNHLRDWLRSIEIGDILGLRTFTMMPSDERKRRGLPHERADQIEFLKHNRAPGDLFGPLREWELRKWP